LVILYRDQRKYANKIKPVRKNGHLLLVTLLLANMIVNESLPVIADPILGGGVQSVVVSTVLIVM
jgi:metal transporter CNNM